MTHELTLTALTGAGILAIGVVVGGSVAGLPAMATSLPGAVTAGLVAVLVLAVLITGITGAENTERTPYW